MRLLTLTGPGGTGKTRLALQAGADLLEEYEDGVFFVDLAAATDPDLFLTEVAGALGLREGGNVALPELLEEYLGRRELLLVLDNFEQILSAAPLAGDAGGDLPVDAIDGVSSLLDKSLIRQEDDPGDEPRFVMLETIHEFARERLEESGEADAVKRAHAGYFLALAEEAEPELRGPDQVEWMERLEAEHDNPRAALSWALEYGEAELALRLAGALWWFWSLRGHWIEGIRWCEKGLESGDGSPPPVRAKALLGAGALNYKRSEIDLSVERVGQAFSLYRQAGDRRGEATCLGYLGTSWLDRGDWEKAETLSEESLALAREARSGWDICSALNELSVLAAYRDDLARAKALAEESLATARKSGDIYGTAVTHNSLASTAMLSGDYERAEASLEENLGLLRVIRNRVLEANALNNLALLRYSEAIASGRRCSPRRA